MKNTCKTKKTRSSKTPRIARICGTCGTEFMAMASQVARGYAKYCSRACYCTAHYKVKETRQCARCGLTKERSEFPKSTKNRTRIYSWCKTCKNAKMKEYRELDKDSWLSNHMKRTFGITLVEYKEMLAKQNGRCAICKIKKPGSNFGRMEIDHCHTTGKVRGLLCHNCNAGLGHFIDNVELLSVAIEYVKSQFAASH